MKYDNVSVFRDGKSTTLQPKSEILSNIFGSDFIVFTTYISKSVLSIA